VVGSNYSSLISSAGYISLWIGEGTSGDGGGGEGAW